MSTQVKPHTRPNRRISPDQTLDWVVATRLSAREIDAVRAKAAADSLSVSQWVRISILKNIDTTISSDLEA